MYDVCDHSKVSNTCIEVVVKTRNMRITDAFSGTVAKESSTTCAHDCQGH